jgi:hypothetical protein
MDWAMAYSYAVLCAGCYASYFGAPILTIILVGTLLALPNIARARGPKISSVEIAAHVVTALMFALAAHIVGWGIVGVMGS